MALIRNCEKNRRKVPNSAVISEALDVDSQTIRRQISYLDDHGFIERVGERRYQVCDDVLLHGLSR